jgi:glycosyltransferase involved in cell wall biosynthesis
MRVLHIDNIASVPATMVRELRKMGHDALLIGVANPNTAPCDVTIVPQGSMNDPGVRRKTNIKEFNEIRKRIGDYDIVHVHGGAGMAGMFYSLKKKVSGKKFVIHFHGTDLRKNINTKWHSIGDMLLVSTPDLLAYTGNVGGRPLVHLPNPIDLEKIMPVDMAARKPLAEKKIIISHLPSHRGTKGTAHIIKAVKTLKRGYDIELDLIENVKHEKALKRLAASDICIDWVSKGFDIYGMVSIEAMALGIPTICRFNTDHYSPPIQNSEPKELATKIEQLVTDRKLYLDLSKKGRTYVEKVHDSKRVVRTLVKYYKKL